MWHIEYDFDPDHLTSTEPIRLDGVSMCYGQRMLFRDVSALVRKGERIAIVAPNGTGKTTLLRLIIGDIETPEGNIVIQPSAVVGYLDQNGEQFDDAQNIVDVLCDIRHQPDDELLTLLHRCGLFRDAHLAHKSVGDLSLGQRRKLGLAYLIHRRANVLLLDEPTNHLDLMSLEALESALTQFEGAIVAATHDFTHLLIYSR